MDVQVVLVRGRSGSGKTTVITRILPALIGAGYRVGVAKHTSHVTEFDRPGKDSHRFREAGAAAVLAGGKDQAALFFPADPDSWEVSDIVRRMQDVDLVLIEGFRRITGGLTISLQSGSVRLDSGNDSTQFDRDDIDGLVHALLAILKRPGG